MATSSCDVLVIGGGPAGSVAAALLARSGLSVVLLERKAFPRRKVCGEYISATNWPLLAELGVAEEIDGESGPQVRRVGLLVGDHELVAELPLAAECHGRWGRAFSRDRLDSLLIQRAVESGVEVRQPWDAKTLTRDGQGFVCRAASAVTADSVDISSGMIIAAHGSWDVGNLPTHPVRSRPQPGDLLGFKAHFQNSNLPEDLMPLLCFPGGYGGMVHADQGRVSLSCCVRRDQLERIQGREGRSDGGAVRAHIEATTPAVQRILRQATLDGHWLSAGPIRPGIRSCYEGGVFRVGNVAGEAHPAVAEGITMALQSARLLVEQITNSRGSPHDPALRDTVGRNYARAWRSAFTRRIRASQWIAHWSMRPRLVTACLPVIRQFPNLLTWGARQSGKADVSSLPITTKPSAGTLPLARAKL